MTWNCRIMRHVSDGEVWYGIHEVFYENGKQTISWTESPLRVLIAESPEGLIADLEIMLRDAKASLDDILEYGEEKS